jgi:outer membrane lipoprotein-sorting protein
MKPQRRLSILSPRLVALGLALLLTAHATPLSRVAAQDQDPKALLAKAAQTMAAVQSFHFTFTTPRGKSMVTDQLELAGIEGDVQRPDRFRASFTAKASIISLKVKVIGIGNKVWATDPTKRDETWILVTENAQGELPLPDLLNPDRLLQAAVDLIQNPTIAGEDEVDGTKTTRIEGTFDPSQVSEVAGTPVPEFQGLAGQAPIPLTIWIDDGGLVRRLQFAGPLTRAESPDVVRQLDITKIDEPVDIQPPA